MKKTTVYIRPKYGISRYYNFYGDVSVVIGKKSITVVEHDKEHKDTFIVLDEGDIISVKNWG